MLSFFILHPDTPHLPEISLFKLETVTLSRLPETIHSLSKVLNNYSMICSFTGMVRARLRGTDHQEYSLLFIQHDRELYAVYQPKQALSVLRKLHLPSIQLFCPVRLQLYQHHVERRQASRCGTTFLRVSLPRK